MNRLTEVCQLKTVGGLALEPLRECINYGQSFVVTPTEWVVIGIAALLGLRVAVFGSKKPLAALEGLLLAAIAAYFGSVGGLIFAEWMPPWMMGAWLLFVALAAIALLLIALAKGTADWDWKLLGSIEVLVLAGAFITVAIIAFKVPDENAAEGYELYLNSVTWLFTGAAVIDALFAATYGSYHWGFSWWLLVPVNASWGALGNLMGIVHHTLSWNCFAGQGGINMDNRSFYTRYANGLRLRYSPSFAFTQGAVMSSPPVEKHESQHVLQHFIFGPIFTVSYIVWFVPAALVGLFVGLVKGKGISGVEAWTYYNNPWEIWAYAVEGGRSQNGDKSLIWGDIASWIVAILYYIVAVGGFVMLLVLRHMD